MPQLIFKQQDGTELVQELEGTITIGRHPDNLLFLEDESVSSHHAKIEVSERGVFVTDLFSSNGTYVNNEKVMVQQLQQGDTLRFGKAECSVAV